MNETLMFGFLSDTQIQVSPPHLWAAVVSTCCSPRRAPPRTDARRGRTEAPDHLSIDPVPVLTSGSDSAPDVQLIQMRRSLCASVTRVRSPPPLCASSAPPPPMRV